MSYHSRHQDLPLWGVSTPLTPLLHQSYQELRQVKPAHVKRTTEVTVISLVLAPVTSSACVDHELVRLFIVAALISDPPSTSNRPTSGYSPSLTLPMSLSATTTTRRLVASRHRSSSSAIAGWSRCMSARPEIRRPQKVDSSDSARMYYSLPLPLPTSISSSSSVYMGKSYWNYWLSALVCR